MRSPRCGAVLCGLLLLVAVGCDSKPSGKQVPDWALPFIGEGGLVTNKRVALSSFRGRVTVLDLWATWCPPCRETLPLLEAEVVTAHGQDVALVSICTDGHDKPTEARELVRKLSPGALLLADDGSFAERMGVGNIPHVIVIDRNGVVVAEHSFDGAEQHRTFVRESIAAALAR